MSPNITDAATTSSFEVAQLQRSYGWSINNAVEAGRSGLVAELADSYLEEARDLTHPAGLVGDPAEQGMSDGGSARRSAMKSVHHYVGKVVRPRGPLGS
jgi:hypothetical protein